jgi:hypothetical protein
LIDEDQDGREFYRKRDGTGEEYEDMDEDFTEGGENGEYGEEEEEENIEALGGDMDDIRRAAEIEHVKE